MRCAHGKRMCPTIYVTGCGSASAQLQTRRQQSRRRAGRRRAGPRARWFARRQWARRPRARRRRACARTTRCAAARHAHAPRCRQQLAGDAPRSRGVAQRRLPRLPAPAGDEWVAGRERGEDRHAPARGLRGRVARVRARSSARRTVAAAAAAAAAAGPRTRRGAAVAPGSANTRSGAPRESAEPPEQPRRARPMSADNVPSTTCGRRAPHGSRSRRAGEKPGPAAGAAAGGDIPQGAAHRRGRASAHDVGTAGLRVRKSRDIDGEFCSIYRI